MLAVPAVRVAPPHFEAMRTSSVAVAAARTTGAVVVDSQLNLAQRALGFNDRSDGSLRLVS
jgi:hypothetical protein